MDTQQDANNNDGTDVCLQECTVFVMEKEFLS
jgi:hypothetical protein